MDIIIYSPDPEANAHKAQAIIASHFGVWSFIDAMPRTCMVTPTLENLVTMPHFDAVLADELPTFIHLMGAMSSVQQFRKANKRPDLLAVYCTTEHPYLQ